MAQNIRFNYLYRDSGNFKKFGHKDYANPNSLTTDEAEKLIREHLISHEFFYPEQAGIVRLRFHRYLEDNSWYEFESVEIIEGKRCKETFTDFLKRLKS